VPPAREDQVMVYDQAHGKVVMFGGRINHFSGTTLSDTWTWDGTDWHQEAGTGPSQRFGAAASYDPIRQQVVLFGGADYDVANDRYLDLGDTWIWDGTSWTQKTVMVYPPKRHFGGIAWDAAREKLVLVGGTTLNTTPHADAWEWDGQAWTLLALQAPFASYQPAVIEAPEGAGIYAFDAAITSGSSLAPTIAWRLQWNAPIAYDSCSADDADGDGKVQCADPDCWAACSPLCPPGTTCPASGPTCGDGTCGPVEDCDTCPGDCGACPTACGDFTCNGSETAATCPSDC
jgi:hypothetical protein